MKERMEIHTNREALNIGIVLSIVFTIAGIILNSISFSVLGIVVGIFLWRLGYVITDIVFDGNYVELVRLNKKRIKFTMDNIIKVDNYKNYIFIIKTKDGKTFVGTDSVTYKMLIWINGESHARIQKRDFPNAEHVLH